VLFKRAGGAELYKYITGIVQTNKHKLLAINGMADHIHVLFGFRPTQSLSDLMQDIKGNSSKWINEKGFIKARFSWQDGYGAFSYSKSDLPKVIQYIKNQEERHKRKSFIDEYKDLLNEFEIDYDERFVFKPVDHIVPDDTSDKFHCGSTDICVPNGTLRSGEINRSFRAYRGDKFQKGSLPCMSEHHKLVNKALLYYGHIKQNRNVE
jgi:putative transposase